MPNVRGVTPDACEPHIHRCLIRSFAVVLPHWRKSNGQGAIFPLVRPAYVEGSNSHAKYCRESPAAKFLQSWPCIPWIRRLVDLAEPRPLFSKKPRSACACAAPSCPRHWARSLGNGSEARAVTLPTEACSRSVDRAPVSNPRNYAHKLTSLSSRSIPQRTRLTYETLVAAPSPIIMAKHS